jgi:predicted metal-dependent phosphoesterase TrpH
VELETDGRKHTLILNAHKDAEKIKSYKDIQQYKVKHPESMIIAPHPYYPAKECHRGNTEKYIHLFDALECSWFNHPLFNFNRRAKEVCKKHNKPFIATPDCHFMRNIGTSYCTIKSKTRTTADIISALKGGEFKNTNKTISFTKFILTLIWIIYGKLFFDRQSRRKLK